MAETTDKGLLFQVAVACGKFSRLSFAYETDAADRRAEVIQSRNYELVPTPT